MLCSAAFMGCGGNVGRVASVRVGEGGPALGPRWPCLGGWGWDCRELRDRGGGVPDARAGAGLLAPHPLVQRLPISEFTN